MLIPSGRGNVSQLFGYRNSIHGSNEINLAILTQLVTSHCFSILFRAKSGGTNYAFVMLNNIFMPSTISL